MKSLKSASSTAGRKALMRRLMACVLGVFLMSGTAVAIAGPAAAVGCYGDYCSGQNPAAMGCDADAVTRATASIPGTGGQQIELRWSPTCKTNWTRVPSSWGTNAPNQVQAVQRDTGYKQIGVVQSNANYSWTRMIYSPKLCVYAAWVGPPGTASTSCS